LNFRARLTLPHFFAVNDQNGSTSVIAREPIAPKTRLGPFEAPSLNDESLLDEVDFVLKVSFYLFDCVVF
jgi:hypothetical protein